MNRRDTIKSLLLGSVAVGFSMNSCSTEPLDNEVLNNENPLYGRTEDEKKRDLKLTQSQFFNDHELLTIAVLCDIILPKNEKFGSATETGIEDFIEFIVKDIPNHQIPIRGGLMWLDHYSNNLYHSEFINCSNQEQLNICDQIAFPEKTAVNLKQGAVFFTRMRNLTLTGYFTSKMGIEDLGYQGNTPNVWDGIPADVLRDHGLKYDDEWLSKCVDQSKRNEIAQWNENGDLIS